jgi:hypothetical protein
MSGHIWLEKRVAELEEKLEEVSKDRDDWAKKYQELSKKNEVTYEFDHTKGCATQYTHIPYGYRIITHNDGSISVTLGVKELGTTVEDAWQKYCEEMMPQKTAHVYPLAGAMYKTFVTAWNAALKEKK